VVKHRAHDRLHTLAYTWDYERDALPASCDAPLRWEPRAPRGYGAFKVRGKSRVVWQGARANCSPLSAFTKIPGMIVPPMRRGADGPEWAIPVANPLASLSFVPSKVDCLTWDWFSLSTHLASEMVQLMFS